MNILWLLLLFFLFAWYTKAAVNNLTMLPDGGQKFWVKSSAGFKEVPPEARGALMSFVWLLYISKTALVAAIAMVSLKPPALGMLAAVVMALFATVGHFVVGRMREAVENEQFDKNSVPTPFRLLGLLEDVVGALILATAMWGAIQT